MAGMRTCFRADQSVLPDALPGGIEPVSVTAWQELSFIRMNSRDWGQHDSRVLPAACIQPFQASVRASLLAPGMGAKRTAWTWSDRFCLCVTMLTTSCMVSSLQLAVDMLLVHDTAAARTLRVRPMYCSWSWPSYTAYTPASEGMGPDACMSAPKVTSCASASAGRAAACADAACSLQQAGSGGSHCLLLR